ncbi:MAG TPA: tetratricopeptide repeat protein [Candidatus Limnocylindrales bacterium]|nr:tetratricopeptide repeat protein [Candidatus Limnocylindrales bacterium]
MLEAERALAVGLLDQAGRLYGQVAAADPRNAIAIVGLARVALERGDERGAYEHARAALAVDPENPMASHLVMRMGEILRSRGERLPETTAAPGGRPPAPGAPAGEAPAKRPGIVGRLLRRTPGRS